MDNRTTIVTMALVGSVLALAGCGGTMDGKDKKMKSEETMKKDDMMDKKMKSEKNDGMMP